MTDRIATTPFGGARVFARQFLRADRVARQQAELQRNRAGGPSAAVDKWQLLRALTQARDAYHLSDRAVAVLEALLSFYPERDIDGAAPRIVFPSNAELSLRCRGMSPATLRRHLAALVEAGLIFRRDSPNGKRFCRRRSDGTPAEAFGFDLSPLALAAPAIFEQAEVLRAAERERQRLRLAITLHLRDIAKVLQAAEIEARPGNWSAFAERLEGLSGRVSRNARIDDLQCRHDALAQLRDAVERAYLAALNEPEMSASVRENEHHIQILNTDQTEDSRVSADLLDERVSQGAPDQARSAARLPLARVLAVCPQIADYSRQGIRTPADFLAAVALVRIILRIPPSVWQLACETMGEGAAAVAVAAILERSEHIRAAGPYLKTLALKARTGEFSVLPMLRALE